MLGEAAIPTSRDTINLASLTNQIATCKSSTQSSNYKKNRDTEYDPYLAWHLHQDPIKSVPFHPHHQTLLRLIMSNIGLAGRGVIARTSCTVKCVKVLLLRQAKL